MSLDYWMRAVATGDGSIQLTSAAIGLAATGARLRQAVRRYDLSGDALTYEISIPTARFPVTAHIRAELRRGPDPSTVKSCEDAT